MERKGGPLHAGGVGPTAGKARLEPIQVARAAMTAGDAASAAAALDPLLRRGKPTAEALYLMAAAQEKLGRFKKAMDFARRSLGLTDRPETRLLIARCLRVEGETDACVAECDAVLAKQPDSRAAFQLKGAALEAAGRYDEARAVIEPLVDPASNGGRPVEAPLKLEWAKLLVHQKRHDEAIELLDDALGEPLPDALRLLMLHQSAKARDKRGDYDGAFDAAEKANAVN